MFVAILGPKVHCLTYARQSEASEQHLALWIELVNINITQKKNSKTPLKSY